MRKLIPVLIAALLLCSCTHTTEVEEEEFSDGSYNMISDGTSIHIIEDNQSQQDTHIYIPEGMVTAYASEQLDSEQLEIYNDIVNSVANCEKSVPMLMNSDVYTTLLNLVNIEQLSFGHVSGRKMGEFDVDANSFSIDISYRFTPAEMNNMNRAAEAAANKILEGITDDMTEYDKIKYFHDYLIRNCESDAEDKFANTIYGALVNGRALCEGYAKSFSYLCNKVGIDNMIVTGMTTVAHMWNMVKIDGNWYHVDVTWDKPDGMLAAMYPDMVMYQFFMVTDSVIENDHTIWSVAYDAPHAYSTKENYFVKENMYIEKESDIETAVENAFRDAVENKRNTAMVKFDTTNLMLTTIGKLTQTAQSEGSYLKSTIEKISIENDVKLNVSWTDYYSPYRILVFVIDYAE